MYSHSSGRLSRAGLSSRGGLQYVGFLDFFVYVGDGAGRGDQEESRHP